MGGSSGGGGGGGEQMQAPQMQPVPQTPLKTTGYGGMGYTQVPQTFTQQGKPDWMMGNFAAPWWGKDAATGQNLTQGMLQPQAPQAPQAPAAAVQQEDPNSKMMDMARMAGGAHDLMTRHNYYGSPSMGSDIGYGTRGGHWNSQPWNNSSTDRWMDAARDFGSRRF